MEKLLALLGTSLLTLVIGIFITGLLTYVVYDTAVLFELELVYHIPYIQLFGLILLAKLILMRAPSKREVEESLENTPKKPAELATIDLIRLFAYTISLLLAWFVMYIAHWIWF